MKSIIVVITKTIFTFCFIACACADDGAAFDDAMNDIQHGNCTSGVAGLQKLADMKLSGALVNLGNLYESGECVTKDLSKADELFKLASQNGIALGHYRYGLLHFGDKSYKPDYDLVFREWSKAFNLGMPIYSELALLHYQGLGTEKDALQAEVLLEIGIKKGDKECDRILKYYYSDRSSPLFNPEKAKLIEPF